MNRLTQNHIDHLMDMMQQGKLTAAQANVEKVKMARVQLVVGKLTADVRKALNEAVKSGDLGHYKKEVHKPEAYFHPSFDYLARQDRAAHERSVYEATGKVMAKISSDAD